MSNISEVIKDINKKDKKERQLNIEQILKRREQEYDRQLNLRQGYEEIEQTIIS